MSEDYIPNQFEGKKKFTFDVEERVMSSAIIRADSLEEAEDKAWKLIDQKALETINIFDLREQDSPCNFKEVK